MTEATSTQERPGVVPEPALEVHGLEISVVHGQHHRPLVTDVSLTVGDGEIVGLVGESGSGKSLTALACMGLLPDGVAATQGDIRAAGASVVSASRAGLRSMRGPRMAMIFQDPMTSLDPCFRIGRQMVEAITEHESVSKGAARRRAIDFLGHVGVPEPQRRFDAFPHELSGGLRQRVMIATALLLEPKLLIADEPTTALDVTTQASILRLVHRLRDELDMSVLWISHDLAVVAQLADRVAVMYAGEIVETGDTGQIFAVSRHHYTRGLLDCASHGERGVPFGYIDGVVPEPAEWLAGCRFANRCPRADSQCQVHPEVSGSEFHGVRCHHPLDERGLA
ncbi:MAG: ATP-binding cassette domain-containing protein [Frankiales bacterium]|nr:ATP-binding cassette domain-containing protein [Frankiales bacterium]